MNKILPEVIKAYRSRKDMPSSTSALTNILQKAVEDHPPPYIRGRRIKLRFAHLGTESPIRVIVHGKQAKECSQTYKKYLENYYRNRLKLYAYPVIVHLKQDDNPFKRKSIKYFT